MRRSAYLAGVLCAAALALPATASASRSQFTIFDAPTELKSADAGVRDAAFDEIESFGVHWIRVILYWHDVAPHPGRRRDPQFDQTDPGAYPAWRWAPYDRIIQEAERRGMRVLLTVSGPVPRWATLSRRSTVKFPSALRFGRFMEAVGRRYRDAIDYWSVWNEPNHPQFLGPQWVRGKPYAPKIYRRLFRAARKGLRRSGNRRDRVLFGETAPNGSGRIILPLRFLRSALCLNSRYKKRRSCKKLDIDGFAHHPYTTRKGPRYRPRNRDAVMIGTLSRLRRALDRAARARAIPRRVGIYLTEFGIQSKPDPIYGVSQTRQAEWRALAEQIAYRNPRVRAFSQYLMRDDAKQGRRYGGFESGLRYHRGRRKKAYRAFRLPMTATRTSRRRVRLWGLVRPAADHERVTVYYRNKHQRKWRRLKRDWTDRRGYWRTYTRYKRGRSYLVRWRDEDGRRHAGSRTRVLPR
jgi:hypothetical protein